METGVRQIQCNAQHALSKSVVVKQVRLVRALTTTSRPPLLRKNQVVISAVEIAVFCLFAFLYSLRIDVECLTPES